MKLLVLAENKISGKFVKFFRKHGLEALTVGRNMDDDSIIADVEIHTPQIIMSVNFDRFPPSALFGKSNLKWVNLHFGQLPQYTGGLPVQRSLMNGETEMRITLHFIEIPSGKIEIIAEESTPILMEDTGSSLISRGIDEGLKLIYKNLKTIMSSESSHARNISSEPSSWNHDMSCIRDINWNKTAFEIHNQVRAFARPGDGAECSLNGRKIKIWKTKIGSPFSTEDPPGSILRIHKGGEIEAVTGSGALRIMEYETYGDIKIEKGYRFDIRREDENATVFAENRESKEALIEQNSF